MRTDQATRRTDRKFLTVAASTAIAILVLFGCGGSGSGVSGGGSTGGSPGGGSKSGIVSPTQKSVVETSIATMAKSMSGKTLTQITQAVAAYMKTRSEFKASGIDSTGCAWAVYQDGIPLIFINNRVISSTGKAAHRRAVAPTRGASIPGTKNAVILTGFEPGLNSAGDDAVSMIASLAGMKNYVNLATDATVESLRALPVAGLVYLNTHGGGDGTEDDPYSLWTTTSTGPSNSADDDPDNAYDLAHGYLVHAVAEDGSVDSKGNNNFVTHYCITPAFVKQYMAFNNQALVYLDACFSNGPGSGAMQLAFQGKGASCIAGWSANMVPSVGFPTAEFMFDRMLGTNADTDYPESSPQRPFDFNDALTSALANDLATFPGGPIQGTYLPASELGVVGGPALLAPSISYMTVLERAQDSPNVGTPTLTINGEFGTVQGSVTVAKTSLKVMSWSDSTIQCMLPNADQPGGSGDVQVFSKAMVKSNAVPLTLWQGTVKYSEQFPYQSDPVNANVTDTIYFRADIHQYRSKPGDDPKAQQSIYFRAALPSTSKWNYVWSLPPDTSWVTQNGTLPYGDQYKKGPKIVLLGNDTITLDLGFIFEGDMAPATGKVNIGWAVFGVDGVWSVPTIPPTVVNSQLAGTSDPLIMAAPAQMASTTDPAGHWTHPIPTSFNTDWSIGSINRQGKYYSKFKDAITWDSLNVTSAPNKSKGEDNSSN